MENLIKELNIFFKTNNCLQDFIDRYIEIKENFNFSYDTLQNDYCRKVLYRNEKFEIILIIWGAFCESPIHKHPKNGCILHVLSGDLVEERYTENDKLYETNYIGQYNVGYMHDNYGKHKIYNKNNCNVYSLHIYSPPNFYENCIKNCSN